MFSLKMNEPNFRAQAIGCKRGLLMGLGVFDIPLQVFMMNVEVEKYIAHFFSK